MCAAITISPEIAELVQAMLFGCEQCSPDADIPFVQVLRNLTARNGEAVDCILVKPARCPSCQAPVFGLTRVETM